MCARLLLVFLLLSAVALNQEAPAVPPAPASSPIQEPTLRLPDGTILQVALATTVSTKNAKMGDPVEFRNVKAVTAGGLVVIAAGAPAKGSVVRVQPPRRTGKAGRLGLKAESVQTVEGKWAPLRSTAAITQGASIYYQKTSTIADLTLAPYGLGWPLIPFAGLLKGRHAMFTAGSVFSAYLDGGLSAGEESVRRVQPRPPPVHTGPGVLTVYHLDGLPMHSPSIYIGNEKIAHLDDGQYFQISLPPGTYWIRLWERETSEELEVREGGQYFVRVRAIGADIPSGRGRPVDVLEVQDPVAGALGVASTKSVKPSRVKELSKTDPAKLLADPR